MAEKQFNQVIGEVTISPLSRGCLQPISNLRANQEI